MTIEQAKVYAKLSRKDLEIINYGYAKHYDAICAYAKGAKIECRYNENDVWEETIPSFAAQFEYRVMPSAEQTAEPWKPTYGEVFFAVFCDDTIVKVPYDNSKFCQKRIETGNYFKTREEAEAARERVRAALRNRSPL